MTVLLSQSALPLIVELVVFGCGGGRGVTWILLSRCHLWTVVEIKRTDTTFWFSHVQRILDTRRLFRRRCSRRRRRRDRRIRPQVTVPTPRSHRPRPKGRRENIHRPIHRTQIRTPRWVVSQVTSTKREHVTGRAGPVPDLLVRKAYTAAYDRRLRHPAWVSSESHLAVR